MNSEELELKVCKAYQQRDMGIRTIATLYQVHPKIVKEILIKKGISIKDKRQWNKSRDD